MYYGVTICLVSFATALTVFTLNIHHKGLRGSPVPGWLKRFVFGVLARLLRITLDPPDHYVLPSYCAKVKPDSPAEIPGPEPREIGGRSGGVAIWSQVITKRQGQT